MRRDWNEYLTVTLLDGEPTVVVWREADVEEAMDAATEMGLPLALSVPLAAELRSQRDAQDVPERPGAAERPE